MAAFDLINRIQRIPLPEGIVYPAVDPLPAGIKRPFWSVMITVYDRTLYLERALKSVLDQDPGPDDMQIEVVADYSGQTDLESVVREIGGGRISFFRQSCHVGMSANWTTCIARACGRWVHILHDDDIVMPGFYAAYKGFIQQHPEAVLVFGRAILIDERDHWIQIASLAPRQLSDGMVENAASELVTHNMILTPTAAVARDAYEKVGGFASFLAYAPDWDMWMRVALAGPIGYVHQPYLMYRVHSSSATNQFVISGKNMEDIVRTIEIGVHRLPPQIQQEVRARAYRNYSVDAYNIRTVLHAECRHAGALQHAMWSFRLHPSFLNLLRLFKSLALTMKSQFLRR
jgi:glycosyltransferase involved in cell wall biosynthesis